MNAIETSDRRLKLDPSSVRVGHLFGQGYFLDEAVESLRLENARFCGFGILNSHFEGGQWLGVKLERVDMACVRFRHVYFENVDFGDCTFASVVFDACVFSGCVFDLQAQGLEKRGCHEVRAAVPPAQHPREQGVVPPVAPTAEAAAPKPPANPVQDRFDRIER